MGFQYQTADIVAGTVLVVERIQSQNYQAGALGWAIFANGDAEFANLVARGQLVGGQVVINGTAYPNSIALYTMNNLEVEPATIRPSGSGGGNVGILQLNSPKLVAAVTPPAQLTLNGFDDGHGTVEMDINGAGSKLRATVADTITLEAGSVLRVSNDFTTYARFISGVWQNEGAAWAGTATTPLSNAWIDTAGARYGYFKDTAGTVHLRGLVRNGTAVGILTLPAGFRPSSNLDFTVQNKTTSGIASISVSTAGVVAISTNFVSGTMQVYLDVISFPTL